MRVNILTLDTDLTDRFWSKVTKGDGCWLWTAALDRNGYGRISVGGKSGYMESAHVLSYRIHHGLIPAGREVHHTCRNRACVNPEHLQAVTHAENCSAENSAAAEVNSARQRAITHCPRNHAYDAANTRIQRGGSRRCKTCDRDAARLRRAAS